MNSERNTVVVTFIGGIIFGIGLAISKMTHPEVVLDFLQLDDLGLLFVLGGAASVSLIVFQIASRTNRVAPITGKKYSLREREINNDLIFGGVIFGIGWGISGICPGAAFASLGIGNYVILWGIIGMFLGAYGHGILKEYRD
jgi:uncharacterized membrane protein YedE/YeeE